MKNMITKAMALTTALMLSAALAGCSNTPAPSTDNSTPAQENNNTPTDAAQNAEAENSTSTQDSNVASNSADAQNTASDLDYVKNKGTLVVGITDFEPMDYKDENGEWIGFDADMAKAFAESLNVSAEFVEIDWDNKIMELEGKTIDCV